ncbi:MAG: ABC transporter permease [Candidatus Binatia bacterium]
MWRDAILLALRQIRRNKMRSFLTVLGIVIGVAAVITMVTVGRGATARISADISALGSNLLFCRPGARRGGMRAQAQPFSIADADAIREQVGGLNVVVPTASHASTVIFGSANRATAIIGATTDYLTARAWDLASGRNFTLGELHGGKSVCLIGETVRAELFGGHSPVGESVRVGKIACEVIGILEPKGQSSMGSDQDDTVVMPLRTVQRRFAGNTDIDSILVSVADAYPTEKVMADVTFLLRERRRIAAGEDDDFTVYDMKEITAALTGTTQIMTMLLGAVAAVSLLVGGIGIMNIMLVSVTERTREIGTRLAVGALEGEVLLQFLVEAVVLSLLGGLVGVLLALAATLAITIGMELPFLLDPGIVALSFGVSGMIGILFGFFPARRAARLDPIEALRHE